MNRTTVAASLLVASWGLMAVAQAPVEPPAPKPQADPIEDLVALMRAGEQQLKTVAIEMASEGQLVGGPKVSVRGSLRVVRGEQAAVHTRFEYRTDDGLRGRSESAQTAAGIVLFEDSPAAGDLYVQIDPKLVADLAWAGEVLQRDDLPGMAAADATGGRRASAPLGSAVVAASRRHFVLAIDATRRDRQKEPGTWLVGPRRPGLDVQDPDLPVADRVEMFVRTKDHALLEMKQFVGDVVVQQLVVDKLEVDVALPEQLFVVDGGNQRLRPVRTVQPLAEQIEQACVEAELKSEQLTKAKNDKLPPEQHTKPELRPSKR